VTGNVIMMVLQLRRLRAGFSGRLEGGQTLMITLRILVATAIMAAVAWGLWAGLDRLLGTSLIAQLISVGVPVAVACVLYGKTVLVMRIPEARQIETLILGRLRGRTTG
jgi:putative peptidoglycan lipid II flippase